MNYQARTNFKVDQGSSRSGRALELDFTFKHQFITSLVQLQRW